MAQRVWGIKLGSGGVCVEFCEQRSIVGIGWQDVDPAILTTATRDDLWSHVKSACTFYTQDREVGAATGQLYRFGRECTPGDYVLYYNPLRKCVRVCRVVSESLYRDFDLEDETDIWHYRRVEYPSPEIPILDFYGSLKGSLLGPRMSFWDMGEVYDKVDLLAHGQSPNLVSVPDKEMQEAYHRLKALVIGRSEALTDKDWEWLVVDYLKAQGAVVDERRVGKNQPIIDVEARFDHGELDDEVWRVQVKRYQDRPVDWPEIEYDFQRVGSGRFCFVSVFGFTDEARQKSLDAGIRLLEAGDFVRFLMGGKVRPELQEKLRLPTFGA
ncbi:MAG: restriction endonuclease [Pirellulales bacterium]|nr:restriction endonuclease [Pirellulales bacterium]